MKQKAINSDLELGDHLSYELEFENMGRNAATILSSNFEYKLQRFVEENIMAKYKEKKKKKLEKLYLLLLQELIKMIVLLLK